MNWYLLLIFFSIILFLIMIKPIFSFDLIGLCLFCIILFSVIIIILTNHLFTIFLTLEIQAFTILIFLARNRSSVKSSEAALKYFILGALSSGIFLLGTWIIYFSSFNFNITEINYNNFENWILLGKNLIALSLFFKLGSAPLHFWILDIYESVNWKTLSIIAILPKIAYISLIIKLFNSSELILTLALLSILIGTFGAFNQTKIKRLLGYSTINHTGFYLITLCLPIFLGVKISYFYFLIYLITFLFFIILCLTLNIQPYIIQLSGLQNYSKWYLLTFLIIILSLAGLPPFSGFLIKWFTLWNLIEYNFLLIGFLLIFLSILTIAFYLNLVKILFFQEKEDFNHWNTILSGKLNKKISSKKLFNFNLLSFGLFLSTSLIFCFDFLVIIIEFFLLNSI